MTNESKTSAAGREGGAQWIVDMREHFRVKGFYRADDLSRLLGDPRDHAEVQVSTDPPANFSIRK